MIPKSIPIVNKFTLFFSYFAVKFTAQITAVKIAHSDSQRLVQTLSPPKHHVIVFLLSFWQQFYLSSFQPFPML